MKLRRVEIQGFKSFGRKTLLEFPEGISVIVGPNGSGKSNLIDAICFALGYPSRNLRAARAQELIHSGRAGNVPHAKVALTLQRGNEVLEVKRKVDRKGRSVYKVNTVVTSLEDLHDTLTKHNIPKDGFNIVMQNDVTKVIEVKPLERRRILDDISGISGYEDKKKKSLEELAVVERRISDTNLILSEKKGYLDEIGKDREIAMKYQDMQDELKLKKSIYLYSSLYKLENEAGVVEDRISQVNKEKDIKIIELARIEEEIEGISQKLEEITTRIIKSSAGEQGKMRGEIGALKSSIEKKQEEVQFLKGEIEGLNGRKKQGIEKQREIQGLIREREKELERLKLEVGKVAKAIATKEKGREDKAGEYDNSEMIALEKERKLVSEELFEAKKSLTIIEKELDIINKREGELDGIISRKAEDVKRLELELGALVKGISKLGVEAEKMDKLSNELDGIESTLSERFQEFARIESEIKTIERMEARLGESESLRFVSANKAKGYMGQVSELGTTPEKYAKALEAAAGDKSKCLVVRDDKAAQWYIEGLRKQRIGRATFLPLDKIHGPETKAPKAMDGILGFARDLIKCEKRYQRVFDFVFGDTLVVRDIDTARKVGIGTVKMATLDGDIMSAGGAMTGGYQRAAITFSSTAEQKRRLDGIKKEIASLKERKERLGKGLGGREGVNLAVMKEKRSNLEEKLGMLRDEVSGFEKELLKLDAQRKDLTSDKAEGATAISKLEKKYKDIEGKMDMDAFREMNDILQTIDGEVHDLKDHRFELQSRENSMRGEIEGMRGKIKDIDHQMDEIDKSISKFQRKIQENIDQITGYGGQLRELEEKHSLITKESQGFFKEQERLNQLIKELGERKGVLEAGIEKLKNESNELEVKKAKVETKLEELKAGMEGVEPPKKGDMEDANIPALKKRVKELEDELGAIEGVNLRAVDMYDELEKQYAEIKERNERLYVEKEKIYDLIETIEEKKKSIFFDSFYKVKENFVQIISELYPSTEGNLLLENEGDPFSSGLIIEVSPRGRAGMNIDSLSGGEKVLTALAFLMATQGVTPSPFYILDEVDAALDQENVVRLVKFLRNRSHSQFILISHNPETVKHMDAVLGIHMRGGVSEVVGVDMQMVEA
jgi:chromosome segregation protein